MELLFVAIGGAILGLAARYLSPGRSLYGVSVTPAIGAAVASVIWVLLTWLGWTWDGTWIWVISLGAAFIISVLTPRVLAIYRERADNATLVKLRTATN